MFKVNDINSDKDKTPKDELKNWFKLFYGNSANNELSFEMTQW